MKTETLLIIGAVGVAAYLIYRQQQQAKSATQIQTPQQNPNQRNGNVSPENRASDYVHAGVEALDAIAEHFGGF